MDAWFQDSSVITLAASPVSPASLDTAELLKYSENQRSTEALSPASERFARHDAEDQWRKPQ
jgi:hypothetical protein